MIKARCKVIVIPLFSAGWINEQEFWNRKHNRRPKLLSNQVQSKIHPRHHTASGNDIAVILNDPVDIQIDLRKSVTEILFKSPMRCHVPPLQNSTLSQRIAPFANRCCDCTRLIMCLDPPQACFGCIPASAWPCSFTDGLPLSNAPADLSAHRFYLALVALCFVRSPAARPRKRGAISQLAQSSLSAKGAHLIAARDQRQRRHPQCSVQSLPDVHGALPLDSYQIAILRQFF